MEKTSLEKILKFVRSGQFEFDGHENGLPTIRIEQSIQLEIAIQLSRVADYLDKISTIAQKDGELNCNIKIHSGEHK